MGVPCAVHLFRRIDLRVRVVVVWTDPTVAGSKGEMVGANPASLRDAGTLLRDPGVSFVLLTSWVVILATSVRHSFFPLYLKDVGISTTLIGVILSCYSLFQIVARPAMNQAIRRLDASGCWLPRSRS